MGMILKLFQIASTLQVQIIDGHIQSDSCRAFETEETYNLSISKVNDLSKNIEHMLNIWFATQKKVSNDKQSPSNKCSKSIGMDRADNANMIIVKGFKKKSCTSKKKKWKDKISTGVRVGKVKQNEQMS